MQDRGLFHCELLLQAETLLKHFF